MTTKHFQATPFSFSKCRGQLPSTVSGLLLTCIMEEGKPRAHRMAVLLLQVYVAASAEGSENLGGLEDQALILLSAQWTARATCQLSICEKQPKFLLLSSYCRIGRDLQEMQINTSRASLTPQELNNSSSSQQNGAVKDLQIQSLCSALPGWQGCGERACFSVVLDCSSS